MVIFFVIVVVNLFQTMKYSYLYLIGILLFVSCHQNNTNTSVESTQHQNSKAKTNTNNSDSLERVANIQKTKTLVDNRNKKLNWKKLPCGLWQSNQGEIGFQTEEATENDINFVRYITNLASNGKSLKSVIDLDTFHYLGSSFYKDKNHIYTHYVMADGGNFQILKDADVATFTVIGDCYAKDKNYIFGERAFKMEHVDYDTFKTKKGIGCFAKDKNGYYFWDEFIDSLDMEHDELQNVLDKL